MRRSLIVLALLAAGCNKPLELSTGPSATLTPPPIIASFTADATRLGPPNGATLDTYLRWSVLGDAGTSCRIDPKVGDVPMGGFQQVRPGVSTDYSLTCTNRGGTAVRIVSILVG